MIHVIKLAYLFSGKRATPVVCSALQLCALLTRAPEKHVGDKFQVCSQQLSNPRPWLKNMNSRYIVPMSSIRSH